MDQKPIEICLNQIEKKVNFGNRETWTNNEYKKISLQITENSGIRISSSTIRRLFDKEKGITYKPQRETLNALSIFLGYTNWADFTAKISKEETRNTKRFSWKYLVILTTIITFGAIVIFNFQSKNTDYSDIVFDGSFLSSNQVPHTVVVKYDIKKHRKPFYINWNDPPLDGSKNEEFLEIINKEGFLNHTYYNKSNYNITLLNHKGEEVKKLNTQIKTKGWECYILQDELLYNVDSSNFNYKDELNAIPFLEHEKLIDQTKDYRLFYRNYDERLFPNNNFHFQFVIHPIFNNNVVQCNHFQLELKGSKSFLLLTSLQEGCTDGNNLICNDEYIWIDKLELSKLSVPNNAETLFDLIFDETKLSIFKNAKLIYSKTLNYDIGEIKGVRFEFKGKGIIKSPVFMRVES